MGKPLNVAVVGATGAVGQEMLRVLAQRRFPATRIVPLASRRSAGKRVRCGDQELEVEELTASSFDGLHVALFSAGGSVSREMAPTAAAAGAVVIDNSSAFRMDDDVPLVVPEVNMDAAASRPRGIIANPNCSTIQLVVALKPLHDAFGLKRVVVSTYQAVSGAGARAIAELQQQNRDVAQGRPPRSTVLPYPIHGNVVFHDVKDDSLYTEEEEKIMRETRKILGLPSLAISATCVRIPVIVAHGEAVWVELEKAASPQEARNLLGAADGVEVLDDAKNRRYPLPLDVGGTDPVFVGRIRADESVDRGLAMWVVADNLRKGAALNAVQIAEKLVERGL